MKNIKRIIALTLTMVALLSVSLPAFAASTPPKTTNYTSLPYNESINMNYGGNWYTSRCMRAASSFTIELTNFRKTGGTGNIYIRVWGYNVNTGVFDQVYSSNIGSVVTTTGKTITRTLTNVMDTGTYFYMYVEIYSGLSGVNNCTGTLDVR